MTREARHLLDDVLLPLASGGTVRTGGRLGPEVAARLAALAPLPVEGDHTLAEARLSAARVLAPLDALPALGADEWRLAVALHDLLLALDPRRARDGESLLAGVDAVLREVAAAETLGAVLVRFVTFQGVEVLARHETEVSWWAGKARFAGRPAPGRFGWWPRLRRVEWRRALVPLLELEEADERWRARWRRWLSVNPLLAARLEPGGVEAATLAADPVGARWVARVVRPSASAARAAPP